MSEMTKPPLGVCPHWFVYKKRMKELNEAIQRYLDHDEEDYKPGYAAQKYEAIASWAEELRTLASLESRLMKKRGEKHD